MQLPFCKICGEYHRLGHCPLWDEPPEIPKPKPVENRPVEKRFEKPPDIPARPFTPDDMKQETMPDVRPRFDRKAYQREFMRKRRQNERAH